jgi:AcrR family transcriptional regulator
MCGTGASARRSYRGASAEHRQRERRSRLIEAGVEVFGTTGFRAATVDGLCAVAGLTKRYFYESFADRPELLIAVHAHLLARVRDRMLERGAEAGADAGADAGTGAAAGVRVAMAGQLGSFFQDMQDDPRVARILLLEVVGAGPALQQCYLAAMGQFAGMVAGLLGRAAGRPAGQLELVATGLAGAAVHIAVCWVLAGYDRPREQVVADCLTIAGAVVDRLSG